MFFFSATLFDARQSSCVDPSLFCYCCAAAPPVAVVLITAALASWIQSPPFNCISLTFSHSGNLAVLAIVCKWIVSSFFVRIQWCARERRDQQCYNASWRCLVALYARCVCSYLYCVLRAPHETDPYTHPFSFVYSWSWSYPVWLQLGYWIASNMYSIT